MSTTDKYGGKPGVGWGLVGAVLLSLAGCHPATPPHTADYGGQPVPLPLVLRADSNYREYGRRFALARAGWVRVHCTGELAQGEPIPTRDLDNVELFFDMGNQKHRAFGDGDDRHYLISRWPQKLLVQPADPTDRLQYAFAEAGGTRRYEVRVPWASLGYRPAVGRRFGFDCSATDNDSGRKDRMLCWHAPDTDGFLNTALYGTLVLQQQAAATAAGTVGCAFVATPPILDGQVDPAWQSLPIHYLVSCVYGPRVAAANFVVQFRTCWNQDYLFVLFEVQDDTDVFAGNYAQVRDYGWLEDSAGTTLWQLNNTARHNGGALKNRVADTLLYLKPGSYLARYSTDESHSPERWDTSPPKGEFYGIALYRVSGPQAR